MNSTVRAPQPSHPGLTFELDVDDFEIVEEELEAFSGDDLLAWREPGVAGTVHEAILRFLDEKL